jgi:hypothetical protein
MKKSKTKMSKILTKRASKLLSNLHGAPAWISAGGGTINVLAGALSRKSGASYSRCLTLLESQGFTSERLANWLDNFWGEEHTPPLLDLSALFDGKVKFN